MVSSQAILDNSTTKDSLVVHPVLAKYIATRDKRCHKRGDWKVDAVSDTFRELLRFGKVVIGGRATCGTKVDQSWIHYVAWQEVVRKAQSLGYVIEIEPIKNGNGWATKAGGFWDECKYTLKESPNA